MLFVKNSENIKVKEENENPTCWSPLVATVVDIWCLSFILFYLHIFILLKPNSLTVLLHE